VNGERKTQEMREEARFVTEWPNGVDTTFLLKGSPGGTFCKLAQKLSD